MDEELRAATPWGELLLCLTEKTDRSQVRLWLEGTLLMDSALSGSEVALAQQGMAAWHALRPVGVVSGARVLVAGLGIGVTLRELLRDPAVGQVHVVELLAPLVAWNRTALRAFNAGALADRRVACWVGDVRQYLETAAPGEAQFELMLFDIDNGPTWLSRPENAWLYTPAGIETVARRLAAGGVALYWASEAAPRFAADLARCAPNRWGVDRLELQEPARGRLLDYYLYRLWAPRHASG